MKSKTTKTAALALAAALACGTLAGCELVTTDRKQDFNRVIAEVDISNSPDFAEGQRYAQYGSSIEKSEILKRELVANYASYGATYVNSYGYSVEDTYDLIKDSLVNRQIFLQYAQVYFYMTGKYTPAAREAYIAAAAEKDKEIAGLAYFLDEDEIARAEYALKVMFNTTLDTQESSLIETEADEHDHDTARTTPNGVNTENEDFYDPSYAIYTGTNSAANCGSYETLDGSTPTTRRNAYKGLLSNLNAYGLISKGENTSEIESLGYYAVERRSQYESALITKLTDTFEEEAAKSITEDWLVNEKLQKTLASQKQQFGGSDSTALDSALDSVSDSSFVLYAPAGYGYVINILLPFNSLQTQELNDSPADLGDKQGNKFLKRASLLKGLKATDQRSTWFSGHEDFSYEETDPTKAYLGANGDRKYLFFEDSMKKCVSVDGATAQYERIPNYLGQYAYNGSVDMKEDEDGDKEYSFQPAKLTIDDFLAEMTGYLDYAGFSLKQVAEDKPFYPNGDKDSYYAQSNYYSDGKVDYSKFLYYEAKIDFEEPFNANRIFCGPTDTEPASQENLALSVMNELSFAYNTDTANLNSYLGYVVSPNTTDFVKEFEYAAQEAVRGGAGTITVAPSDYGWHIMYCTFAYTDDATEPYTFSWADIEKEGTFSNLYYEALKAENFTKFSSDLQTSIINSFDNDACVTVYLDRYSDLFAE